MEMKEKSIRDALLSLIKSEGKAGSFNCTIFSYSSLPPF